MILRAFNRLSKLRSGLSLRLLLSLNYLIPLCVFLGHMMLLQPPGWWGIPKCLQVWLKTSLSWFGGKHWSSKKNWKTECRHPGLRSGALSATGRSYTYSFPWLITLNRLPLKLTLLSSPFSYGPWVTGDGKRDQQHHGFLEEMGSMLHISTVLGRGMDLA